MIPDNQVYGECLMKIPLMLAIKMVELLTPYEYVGSVSESSAEYVMYLRFKDDDEWCENDAWAVSKKTGRVRALGGEDGFACNDPIIWMREKYSERGSRVI